MAQIARYELRDERGRVLGTAATQAQARRMLRAYILTAPGRELDLLLVGVSAEGQELATEDFLDVDLDSLY